MGFFSSGNAVNARVEQEAAIYRRMGCKLCPLNKFPGRMEPTGTDKPLVYMLGEAPGVREVEEGKQFVGKSGQLLRTKIPREMLPKLRWNNTVRSHPPDNRDPTPAEIESCRPSVEADIERTKPRAIFGFGNVPLQWVSGFSGISAWRGRRFPVRIGTHTCWYYPFLHPAAFLHMPNQQSLHMWKLELKRAWAEVEAGLPKPVVHDGDIAREGIETILTGGGEGVRQIEAALEWGIEQEDLGIDYETTKLRPYADGAKIVTASISSFGRTIAFPIFHPQADFTPQQRIQILQAWKNFLAKTKARKFVHNLSFEMEWTGYLVSEKLLRMGKWLCTAVQASTINTRRGKKGAVGPFSLEFLVQQYFGFNIKKLSNVDRKRILNTPLPKLLTYNGLDAKYHLGLGWKQEEVIKAEGLEYVFELSNRRIPTVVQAQLRGIPINQDEVARLDKKYEGQREDVEIKMLDVPVVKQFKKEKGEPYDPDSPKQTQYIFHDMLGRKECVVKDKFTKKERISCDEDVLKKIKHPLAQLVLDYRGVAKAHGTYVKPLKEGHAGSVVFPDHLVHTIYNTYFPETGRLSAEDPNVQNYPKRDEENRETRKPFVADKECVIVACDYGQIQARIAAMFSKDKAFCDLLWNRYDIHQEWTERLALAYPERVGGRKFVKDKVALKKFRDDVKNQWTFPLLFGAKMESVAHYLGIPEEYVAPEYNRFWKQFSKIKSWQNSVIKGYEERGYIECLTGRRRHGPLALNQIINSGIQGTESEIVMDAMCRLYESEDPELRPELMIHDDLTFLRVPKKRVDVVVEKILDTMLDISAFDWINVPISVEVSIGHNWMRYDKDSNPDGMQGFDTFWSDTWFK